MRYMNISNYPLEHTKVTYPFVWWDGGFTDDELDRIVSYCDGQGYERARVIGENRVEEIEKVRRCDIKFHNRNENTAWIFDKMNSIISSLNAQFYGFDLNGYDAFQYTSYNSAESGEYGWHMDTHLGAEELPADMIEPRKLSLSLLLNTPGKDFKGGEFQFNVGNEREPLKPELPRGRVIAFPSFILHRVKPVTSGYRKSLVIWVTGPKFT